MIITLYEIFKDSDIYIKYIFSVNKVAMTVEYETLKYPKFVKIVETWWRV